MARWSKVGMFLHFRSSSEERRCDGAVIPVKDVNLADFMISQQVIKILNNRSHQFLGFGVSTRLQVGSEQTAAPYYAVAVHLIAASEYFRGSAQVFPPIQEWMHNPRSPH